MGVAKYKSGALPVDATQLRRRRLHNTCSAQAREQRKQDLEAAPVDATFEASMMAKVEQAAKEDPTIAAVLAAAKEDPGALVAAAENDPTIIKSLAAFFIKQMANDPNTAIELAKMFTAAPAPVSATSVNLDMSTLVSSDSENNDLSSVSLSLDEEFYE